MSESIGVPDGGVVRTRELVKAESLDAGYRIVICTLRAAGAARLDDMGDAAGWTVIRPNEFAFTPPSRGDGSRGVMRLSDLLSESRANLWRMAPSSRGRRHRETSQEEIFVTIEGTATLALGEPPTAVELPQGTIAIVEPQTPLQLANEGGADCIVLVVGAPPTIGDAEYLSDARLS
jgi:mannose-6-phosphate isomerase-like protein (cupin superfamily)